MIVEYSSPHSHDDDNDVLEADDESEVTEQIKHTRRKYSNVMESGPESSDDENDDNSTSSSSNIIDNI
eukprot:10744685-Ditylum_brightwellii.AAC.1